MRMRRSVFFDQHASNELKEAAERGNYITHAKKGNCWIEWGPDSKSHRNQLPSLFLELFPEREIFYFDQAPENPETPKKAQYASIPIFAPLNNWDEDLGDSNQIVDSNTKDNREFGSHPSVDRDKLITDLERIGHNLQQQSFTGFRSLLCAWLSECDGIASSFEADWTKIDKETRVRILDLHSHAAHIWHYFTNGMSVKRIGEIIATESYSGEEVTPTYLLDSVLAGLKIYGARRDTILAPAAKMDARRWDLEWYLLEKRTRDQYDPLDYLLSPETSPWVKPWLLEWAIDTATPIDDNNGRRRLIKDARVLLNDIWTRRRYDFLHRLFRIEGVKSWSDSFDRVIELSDSLETGYPFKNWESFKKSMNDHASE